MKIRPLGAELFHADGHTYRRTDRQVGRQADRQRDRQTDRQTDMAKLIVAFRNFANAPKMFLSRLQNRRRRVAPHRS
jgi:hypothetical protein